MNAKALLAFMLSSLLAHSVAQAGILYSQPSDNSGHGYASQNDPISFGNFATLFDNFSLASTAEINQIEWIGAYFNGNPAVPTGFQLQISSDASGPGVVLKSWQLPGDAGQTLFGVFGGYYHYSYLANFGGDGFVATGGQTYWLSIVPTVGFPPQWGWATGSGGDSSSVQFFFGSPTVQTLDLAFTLSNVPVSQTPEPKTLGFQAALILGAMVLIQRRRATLKTQESSPTT